jgi:nucleoside-diphosphate-sugar epimerase
VTRALVTGASGFIGSHLVRALVRSGFEVHAVTRRETVPERLCDLEGEVRWHRTDLRDARSLGRAVASARPELVVHLAAAPMIAGETGAAEELESTNVMGTANLIEACARSGCALLVHAGDAFEYGPSTEPLRETLDAEPDSPHGITRRAATRRAIAAALGERVPVVAFRLFSVYGPDDHPRKLVPRLLSAATTGAPIPLSRPEVSRDWLFVGDVVELLLEAWRIGGSLSGELFNAGSGRGTRLDELVGGVSRVTGRVIDARWGAFPATEHDSHPWTADLSKTLGRFSWRPRTTLEEGLLRTLGPAR